MPKRWMRFLASLAVLIGVGAWCGMTPGGIGTAAATTVTPTVGFWLVGSDGGVFAFGAAPYLGSGVNSPDLAVVGSDFVGVVQSPNGGYCIGDAEEGSYGFGGARCGQAKCAQACPSPATSIQPAPGTGVASFSLADGAITAGIARAGDAYHVSAAPIVGFDYTPDGNGYWEVASDGGVFAYGDAAFYGSLGAKHLAAPIVGMARTSDGEGYWLVASDGGVFAFGDATYEGSMGGRALNAPIVGIAPPVSGRGYWLAAADGGVFAFGDAPYFGSLAGRRLAAPITGIASDL